MGLEPAKLIDLVLDEANKQVAIQTDTQGDCKFTHFHESIAILDMFFSMFNSLTDYKGFDENNLHIFQVKKFITSSTGSNFLFLFDENNTFKKARVEKNIVMSDYQKIL